MNDLNDVERSFASIRMDVACPKCGAGIGEKCRSVSKANVKPLAFTHPARRKALFEADSTDQHQQALAHAMQLWVAQLSPTLGDALKEGARSHDIPSGEKEHRFELWALHTLSGFYDTAGDDGFPPEHLSAP